MASARVTAQAKINLFLRVLAREASGFHQLETLFCRLTLGDDVHVRLTASGRSLDCVGEAMPPGGLGPVEQNLAWRATSAFLAATGWASGVAIEIGKRIPVGGGLGGGSADAGAVLRALNAMAPSPLSQHELLRLGASLGADVPFLTQDDSPLALAWGRGARMLALPPLPQRHVLLFAFREGVSTVDAYRWLAESPASALPPVSYSPASLATWDSVELMAYNEFERVVLPRQASIRRLVDGMRTAEVRDVFPVTLMSGSGATVFALPSLPAASKDHGAGYHVNFVVDGGPATADELRLVETSTAQHVEPVRVDD